jgi:hypothetical protein
VAFAALTAAVVAYFGAGAIWVLAAILAAWMGMAVRNLWVEGVREETWMFAALGLGAIVLAAIAGWRMGRRGLRRPWMALGGLSVAAGLALIPASP